MKVFCLAVSALLLTFGDVVAQIDEVRKLEKRGLTIYVKQPLTTNAQTQRISRLPLVLSSFVALKPKAAAV
jgi:hypothetical protein